MRAALSYFPAADRRAGRPGNHWSSDFATLSDPSEGAARREPRSVFRLETRTFSSSSILNGPTRGPTVNTESGTAGSRRALLVEARLDQPMLTVTGFELRPLLGSVTRNRFWPVCPERT